MIVREQLMIPEREITRPLLKRVQRTLQPSVQIRVAPGPAQPANVAVLGELIAKVVTLLLLQTVIAREEIPPTLKVATKQSLPLTLLRPQFTEQK